jgi:diamine N-acetyltransferase
MMHPTAVHIRRAEEADAARLSELGARVFHDTFAATSPPSDLDIYLVSTFGVAKQASELADPAVLTLLAEVDSRPVGYAQLRRRAAPPGVTGPEPVQLWRFYVDRAYHGGGVAQALMAAVYEAARAHGGQTLWLAVWQENRRAIAFYAKCGLVIVGEQEFRLGSVLQQDHIMARVLPVGSLGSLATPDNTAQPSLEP